MCGLWFPRQFGVMVTKPAGDVSSHEDFREYSLQEAIPRIKQRINAEISPAMYSAVFSFAKLDLPCGVEHSGLFERDGLKGRVVQIYDGLNDRMTCRIDVLIVPKGFSAPYLEVLQ